MRPREPATRVDRHPFASSAVEYMAASINGPWHDQRTDNWTAHLIGMCP